MGIQVQRFASNGTSGVLLLDPTVEQLVEKIMVRTGMDFVEVLQAAIYALAVSISITKGE